MGLATRVVDEIIGGLPEGVREELSTINDSLTGCLDALMNYVWAGALI